MDVTFSIKQKSGADWDLIKIESLAGKTLEQSLCGFVGKEVVAEFVVDQEQFFFCGNSFWLERMQRKGKAATFAQAMEILQARCPHLLKESIPGVQDIADVFSEPDTVMEVCTFEK